MFRFEKYQQQHHEIVGTVTDILEQLNENAIKSRPDLVHSLLSRLYSQLHEHLVLEDQTLYPDLLHHRDEAVRTAAEQFMKEMGGLNNAFKEYLNCWQTSDNLQIDPQSFIQASRRIFDALAKRIAKEDLELYPMAAKVGG